MTPAPWEYRLHRMRTLRIYPRGRDAVSIRPETSGVVRHPEIQERACFRVERIG